MTEETQAALDRALRRLQASDRYEAEVRKALSGYAEVVVDEVVEILKKRRLIDDSRTTSNALEVNVGRRAVGSARFRERMERRGAPDELVDEATAQVAEGDAVTAAALLTARFAENNPKDRARAGRFLMGRGFAEEVVESAILAHFGDLEG